MVCWEKGDKKMGDRKMGVSCRLVFSCPSFSCLPIRRRALSCWLLACGVMLGTADAAGEASRDDTPTVGASEAAGGESGRHADCGAAEAAGGESGRHADCGE